ncbi:MAG: DEAD/DEAH box helicase, partial [Acidimicrobiales bacterium]
MSSSPDARATFADLGVPDAMARNLAERGIDAPFPIQAATLPEALAGRDLCGRAPTGSGKTLAFGIPLIAGVQSVGRARPKRPRGLVLVPTRELAAQVCKELQLLAKPRGPWVESFYGGTAFPRQVNALRRGVDIAVACPGRLADLINQGCVDLGDVSFVVLDEADRMADMGFLPEVERLLRQCADRRQSLLFSATLDGDVEAIIDRYMHDAVRHELDSDEDDLAKSTHLFWKVEPTDRANTAAALVDRHGPTVVFCRTKRGADRVTRQLEAAGVSAAAIHGDRSQGQRDRALRSFHKGHVAALVATDVAARGIHVDNVACVIHYDPPADHKDYVHRSGRTARAGATGLVVTLVVPQVKGAVARLQRALELPTGLTAPDLSSGAARFAETAAVGPTYTPSSGPSSARSPQRRPSKPRRDRVDSRSNEQRRGERSSEGDRNRPTRPADAPRDDRDREPYDRDRRPYDRRAKRDAPSTDGR